MLIMNQKIKNSYIFIKFALKNDEFARKNVDKNFYYVNNSFVEDLSYGEFN